MALLFGVASSAIAADHRDGTAAGVQLPENIPADINDVYAFVNGGKVVLGMTVFPFAAAGAEFSPDVVYAFHVDRHEAVTAVELLSPPTEDVDVLCTFDAAQTIECWIGDTEYVTGDPSTELESSSGKFKVFAGLRQDPFFFNLTGFNTVRTLVRENFGGLGMFPSGCLNNLTKATADVLRDELVGTQGANNFAALLTLAIVIEADADLFTTATEKSFSVYASTHAVD